MRISHEEIQKAEIGAAGAFISIDGRFLFALGAKPHNRKIPVYRLGGHLEPDESGWDCAVREIYEETGLDITPASTPITYFLPNGDNPDSNLEVIKWQHHTSKTPTPYLVVAYQRDDTTTLSLMYRAKSNGDPQPAAEVKGLVFLTNDELHRLCQDSLTLGQFLGNGGKAILNHEFDQRMVLEPFLQVKLLSKILLKNE